MLLKRKIVERRGQHYTYSPANMHLHQVCGHYLSRGSDCCQGSS
ncbi:hypothetical protein LINGRAHAP2_LOCUS14979 [Linum grandiflorum]